MELSSIRLTVALPTTFREINLSYIHAALEKTNGNKSQAARALGISNTTLYNYLRKAGLHESTRRGKTGRNNGSDKRNKSQDARADKGASVILRKKG